ncbi:MAG: hypothetical protein ACK5MG_02125 [Bacteroidales bacterium]
MKISFFKAKLAVLSLGLMGFASCSDSNNSDSHYKDVNAGDVVSQSEGTSVSVSGQITDHVPGTTDKFYLKGTDGTVITVDVNDYLNGVVYEKDITVKGVVKQDISEEATSLKSVGKIVSADVVEGFSKNESGLNSNATTIAYIKENGKTLDRQDSRVKMTLMVVSDPILYDRDDYYVNVAEAGNLDNTIILELDVDWHSDIKNGDEITFVAEVEQENDEHGGAVYLELEYLIGGATGYNPDGASYTVAEVIANARTLDSKDVKVNLTGKFTEDISTVGDDDIYMTFSDGSNSITCEIDDDLTRPTLNTNYTITAEVDYENAKNIQLEVERYQAAQ